jgi:hypothetical protein
MLVSERRAVVTQDEQTLLPPSAVHDRVECPGLVKRSQGREFDVSQHVGRSESIVKFLDQLPVRALMVFAVSVAVSRSTQVLNHNSRVNRRQIRWL